LINNYTNRDVSGYASVGCYYDSIGCDSIYNWNVLGNNSFSTATTYLSTFYGNSYFFGLSYFILYSNFSVSDFIDPDDTFSMQTILSSGSG
jgi:hypothetical protein